MKPATDSDEHCEGEKGTPSVPGEPGCMGRVILGRSAAAAAGGWGMGDVITDRT